MEIFITGVWYANNELFCNLYTAYLIIYFLFFDYRLILLYFISQGYCLYQR